MSGKYRYFRACPGPSVLGRGGLKPGWYRYLFDFAGVLRFGMGLDLPIGFGCTITISSGAPLPRIGPGEALR
jgi:hypothetical protein